LTIENPALRACQSAIKIDNHELRYFWHFGQ
jgi:hypothetical protein